MKIAFSVTLLFSFSLCFTIQESFSAVLSNKTEINYDKKFLEQAYFIDKTDMLKLFLKNPNNTYDYVSCPSGFGKTTNLLMIKAFTEYDVDDLGRPKQRMNCKAYNLFRNTKIDQQLSSVKDDIGQHPVIFISLKVDLPRQISEDTDSNTTEIEFTNLLNEFVHSFVAEFKWLKMLAEDPSKNPKFKHTFEQWEVDFLKNVFEKNLTAEEIPKSLYFTAKILFNVFKKRVILLVDDFDYVDHNAWLVPSPRSEQFRQIVHEILRELLDTGREMVSYAMLVGVSKLPLEVQKFTGDLPLNHHVFLSDHKYGEYFGYLINDVRHLSIKHKCDKSELQQIQDLYEGYETKIEHRKLFNPFSITSYFKERGFNTKIRPLNAHWIWGQGEQDFVTKFITVSPQFFVTLLQLAAYNSFSYQNMENYPEASYTNFIKLQQRQYQYLPDEADPIAYLIPFCFEHGLLSYTIYEDEYILPNAEVHQQIGKTLGAYYKEQNIDFEKLATVLENLLDCSASTSKNLVPELKQVLDCSLKVFAHVASSAPIEYLLQSIIKQTVTELNDITLTEEKKISRKGRCEVIYATRGDRSIVHIAITSAKTPQQALKEAPGYGRKKHSTKSIYVGINLDSQKQSDIVIEVKTPR